MANKTSKERGWGLLTFGPFFLYPTTDCSLSASTMLCPGNTAANNTDDLALELPDSMSLGHPWESPW